MKRLFGIGITAIAIILFALPLSFAQTTEKPDKVDNGDIRVLEERIKQVEEKNKIRLDGVEKNIKIQNKAIEENIKKDINSINDKIDTNVKYIGIIGTIILMILTFLGYKTIQGAANKAVENLTVGKLRSKWNEEFQKYYDQRTNELVEGWEDKFAEFDKKRSEYEISLKNIKDKVDKIDISAPIPESITKILDEFKVKLENVKTEDDYTAEDWFYRGIRENEEKRYNAAIESFTKAIGSDPQNYRVYVGRGIAYREFKEYERALADYDKAIELNPTNPLAYNNRGNIYSDSEPNEYDKALADYDKAIELDPGYADAYYNRGIAYAKLKEYEKALADYDKAIELDPGYADAYYNRGIAYAKLKEYEKALADYTKAIELDPKDTKAYVNRGAAYAKLKEHEKALADYEKAIELDSEYVNSYINMAELLIILGNYELSLEKTSQALKNVREIKDKAVLLYLKCIAEKFLGKDTVETEKEYEEILRTDFDLTWSFEEIEEWLKTAEIPEETRVFIEQKTEMLKKKKK